MWLHPSSLELQPLLPLPRTRARLQEHRHLQRCSDRTASERRLRLQLPAQHHEQREEKSIDVAFPCSKTRNKRSDGLRPPIRLRMRLGLKRRRKRKGDGLQQILCLLREPRRQQLSTIALLSRIYCSHPQADLSDHRASGRPRQPQQLSRHLAHAGPNVQPQLPKVQHSVEVQAVARSNSSGLRRVSHIQSLPNRSPSTTAHRTLKQ